MNLKKKKILIYSLNNTDSFLKFLTLIYQKPVHQYNIRGAFKDIHKNKHSSELIYKSINYETQSEYDESLFTYDQVKDKLPDILSNWYMLTKQIRPILNSFFSVYTPKGNYNDKFLNVTRAMEGFYKRRRKEVKFTLCIKGIFEESRLGFNNLLQIDDTDRFCNLVTKFRNELTHHNLEDDVLKNIHTENALFMVTQQLKLIFTCQLLIEVGFTPEEVATYMKESYLFQVVRKDGKGIKN